MTTRAAFHTWVSARRAPSAHHATAEPVERDGLCPDGDLWDPTIVSISVPSESELIALGLPPAPPAELVAGVLRQVRRAETPSYRRWLWRLGDLVLRRA